MLSLELRASQNHENKPRYIFPYQIGLESDQVKSQFLLH